MVRQLLGVALFALIAGACSSTPIDTNQQGASETEMGSVNLPLTTQVGDISYRLNKAVFTISGPALAAPKVVKPPADEPVHNEVLPTGTYSVQLANGWVLEQKGPGAAAYTAVTARLVTANPLTFTVDGKAPADAFFGFSTTSGEVAITHGSVNIRIGVEDCSAYDQYTAALGELTAQCLGTVDPRAYEVSRDGILRPTFDSCLVDQSKLRPIKQLLSLQLRTTRLPFAKECLAGRFAVAQQQFLNSGVEVCPTWRLGGVINPPEKTIDTVLKLGLPELPAADDVRPDPRLMQLLKVQSSYTVALENAPGQKCETPGNCAQICAAAFPGFVQNTDGNVVITDPTSWLIDTTYASSTADPYLRPGYYHPMSYYGPLPGVVFGEYERSQPCGPMVSCNPELCSYYAGSHIKTFLQMDCVDPADINSCVSYCGPKL